MFRIGLDIFNIYLFIVSKRFWNKNIRFNIYGLPLTWKAQVGGNTWAKRAHEGEAPWGSFPPSPLGATLGGEPKGAAPRAALSSKEAPLPLPL